MNQITFIESRNMREKYIGQENVLDKVKKVSYIPTTLIITQEMAANYYEVSLSTIKKVVQRNKDELKQDGLKVLKGNKLKEFKENLQKETNNNFRLKKTSSSFTLITRTALLRLGMLLRDSLVALEIRNYLLKTEKNSLVGTNKLMLEKEILTSYRKIAQEAGLSKNKASIAASTSLLNKTSIYEEIVKLLTQEEINKKQNKEMQQLKKLKAKKRFQQQLINQLISRTVKNKNNSSEYQQMWQNLSYRIQERTGFSMLQAKAKNKKLSYLDIIDEYDWYDMVFDILKNYMQPKIS